VIHHGHFPSRHGERRLARNAAGRGATAQQRPQQEAAYQFYKDWNGPNSRDDSRARAAPTPYFDDSYAVNFGEQRSVRRRDHQRSACR
jgi:hypothetical protein